FREFWSQYPRQTGEMPARAEFASAIANGALAADIIAGALRYGAYVSGENVQPRYVKEASNWLRDRRWLDKPEPSKPKQPNGRYRRNGGRQSFEEVLYGDE